MLSAFSALVVALASPPGQGSAPADPYLLPIGRPGTTIVRFGLTDMRTGRQVTAAEFARAARGYRWVLLGEEHDSLAHHEMQADLIEALVEDGRHVVVGFEQFTRPSQRRLAPWTLGWWSEEEFIEKSGWRDDWNMDFALYRPIFEVVRRYRLPMVALNIPRAWVRTVSREGWNALSEDVRRELPEPYLGNEEHRAVFSALMGGHPTGGASNVYAAQVLWDEAMADTAIRFMENRLNPKAVMVIVTGSGHVMYGQGINYRITRRTGEPTLTVTAISIESERSVSNGLGDFVFASRPPAGRAAR